MELTLSLSSAPKLYRPRRPERSPFYAVLHQFFNRFTRVYEQRFERTFGPLRGIVPKTVERFFGCGLPEGGFARVRCDVCRNEYLVAFSSRVLPLLLRQTRRPVGGIRPGEGDPPRPAPAPRLRPAQGPAPGFPLSATASPQTCPVRLEGSFRVPPGRHGRERSFCRHCFHPDRRGVPQLASPPACPGSRGGFPDGRQFRPLPRLRYRRPAGPLPGRRSAAVSQGGDDFRRSVISPRASSPATEKKQSRRITATTTTSTGPHSASPGSCCIATHSITR